MTTTVYVITNYMEIERIDHVFTNLERAKEWCIATEENDEDDHGNSKNFEWSFPTGWRDDPIWTHPYCHFIIHEVYMD